MLPYLIAGAIGFGIGKLFEEGGETFGRGGVTTNEGIIKSFLNSNKELRVGNLEAVEIDDIMYLRNYRTFIAKRMGDKVKISSQKYSQTTSTITNRLKALAQEMGYSVEYVSEKEIYDFDKFTGGGETYQEKVASIKGGVEQYSVDIDLENGDEIRDITSKSLSKSKKEYDKYSEPMIYEGEKISNIQLIVIYKNGDYDTLDSKFSDKYAGGGETFRRGGRTPKKVIKVRARGGYSLEDFFPLFEVYNEVVSYKKVGKLELQQILGKKDVADEFKFKTEADRDYWFEILNKEQEKYFTVQNKKKYVKYVLDNFGNYSEEAEDNDLKTLSEKLDYFADDLDYDLRLNTTREDFIYYLDLDVKDKYAGGGGVRKYGRGGFFGESAKLEYVDDAFASDELKSELQEKLGISSNDLGDNVVISFAYTDYGGDFLDKVAIRYFQENR